MAGTILFGIDVETASEDAKGFTKFGSELFHELNCPVTWYVTGKTLEKYPDEFNQTLESGLIELQAHTYDHLLLKTVLIKVPDGRIVHEKTDWFIKHGGKLEEIEKDLERCQKVFVEVTGRKAFGFTGPWGYYRGLSDRPDILKIVHDKGYRILRTFARDENDGNPVPFEWQTFFYDIQGYNDILELLIHGYQDDFYWECFGDHSNSETYAEYLKKMADRVASENLVWSIASHDHHSATREGFEKKGSWYRELISYAKSLGIRFMKAGDFYSEISAKRSPAQNK